MCSDDGIAREHSGKTIGAVIIGQGGKKNERRENDSIT